MFEFCGGRVELSDGLPFLIEYELGDVDNVSVCDRDKRTVIACQSLIVKILFILGLTSLIEARSKPVTTKFHNVTIERLQVLDILLQALSALQDCEVIEEKFAFLGKYSEELLC